MRVTGNLAPDIGGAIGIDTGTGSRLTIIDSEITNNTTTGTGSHGGAIGSQSNPLHFIHIKNSLIAGNTSAGGGGAVYSANSTVMIENSLLFDNRQTVSSATVGGGANRTTTAGQTFAWRAGALYQPN